MTRATCNACFENGRPEDGHYPHGPECVAYARQRAFTARLRRLLAADGQIEIPTAPEPTEPHRDWVAVYAGKVPGTWENKANTWAASVYALLRQDGRTYKQFRNAVGGA